MEPINVRFYIGPEARGPHIYNYGVKESEVKDILSKPGEDRVGEVRIESGFRANKSRKIFKSYLCS